MIEIIAVDTDLEPSGAGIEIFVDPGWETATDVSVHVSITGGGVVGPHLMASRYLVAITAGGGHVVVFTAGPALLGLLRLIWPMWQALTRQATLIILRSIDEELPKLYPNLDVEQLHQAHAPGGVLGLLSRRSIFIIERSTFESLIKQQSGLEMASTTRHASLSVDVSRKSATKSID